MQEGWDRAQESEVYTLPGDLSGAGFWVGWRNPGGK